MDVRVGETGQTSRNREICVARVFYITPRNECNSTKKIRESLTSLIEYHLQMLKIPGTFRRKNKHAQLIAHVSI